MSEIININENEKNENRANTDEIDKAHELVEKCARGTFKLYSPLWASNVEFHELKYDFLAIDGDEFATVMDADRDPMSRNTYRLSQKQAKALFALAVEKEMYGKGGDVNVDRQDLKNLSVVDTVRAAQVASDFFIAASRAVQ